MVAPDLGSAVVVTGVAPVSVSSNGTPVSVGTRFVTVYANRGGERKMVTRQSTKRSTTHPQPRRWLGATKVLLRGEPALHTTRREAFFVALWSIRFAPV